MLYCKKKFVHKIPKSNSKLKLELLSKILPFDLDRDLAVTALAMGMIVLLFTLPVWLWLF